MNRGEDTQKALTNYLLKLISHRTIFFLSLPSPTPVNVMECGPFGCDMVYCGIQVLRFGRDRTFYFRVGLPKKSNLKLERSGYLETTVTKGPQGCNINGPCGVDFSLTHCT
jgi:hypothetical protein